MPDHPKTEETDDSPRYLLCRPRGGLNDTLCRIEYCWRYAEKFGRQLVIDTRNSSLFGDFDSFFEIIDDSGLRVHTRLDPRLLNHLNSLSCNPHILTGRLDAYQAHYVRGKGFVDRSTEQPTRFNTVHMSDLDSDSPESVLVYDDSGGGTLSQDFLKRIRFTPSVATLIRETLQDLPQPFWAVHVRNTDYLTDYKTLFKKIRKRVEEQRMLVCSDDSEVLEYAREFFLGKVLSFPEQVRSSDPTGALHQLDSFSDAETRRQIVIKSFIDLIGLGCARHLIVGKVNAVFDSVHYRESGQIAFNRFNWISGFSSLAAYLCLNKQVLNQLLNHPLASDEPVSPKVGHRNHPADTQTFFQGEILS